MDEGRRRREKEREGIKDERKEIYGRRNRMKAIKKAEERMQ